MRYQVKTWSTVRWENKDSQRYYEARLEQDLFGNFVVRKVWGGINKSNGGSNTTQCTNNSEVSQLVTNLDQHRKKRKYTQV